MYPFFFDAVRGICRMIVNQIFSVVKYDILVYYNFSRTARSLVDQLAQL